MFEKPWVRTAAVGLVVAAGLCFILGFRPVNEFLRNDGDGAYLGFILAIPSWEILRGDLEFRFAVSLFAVVFPAAVGVLMAGAIGGLITTRALAGWGAAVLAAGFAAAVRGVAVYVLLDVDYGEGFFTQILREIQGGASFGLFSGWIFAGVAVLLGGFRPVPAPGWAEPAPAGPAAAPSV